MTQKVGSESGAPNLKISKKQKHFPLLILMTDLVFYTDYRVYLNSDGEQFFVWREPAY